MQVVHILGNDAHVKVLLQFHQAKVGGIGFSILQLQAPLIVELVDQRRIAQVSLMTCHVHYRIVFPQAIGITESLDTTLGTDAGARRNH